jgi:trans-2,3-dihydro-3-hydroxyanthranilate isomerase
MRKLDYAVVDVFTDTPYTGNPLAVVFGANGLTTRKLQAIAREFHLSETVFVLPPTNPEATYRVRIFTPTCELPFAGHPSVGAALVQARRGMITTGQVIQECGAGLLPILVAEDGSATLSGGEPTIDADPLDPFPLLAAVGLNAADHVGPPPRSAGCGMAFRYLSVTDDAVSRARLVDPSASGDLSLVSWNAESKTARVRVFAPEAGVPEDPATGSAALGLGVWLVTSGLLPADGTSDYTIHQGSEIERPSVLRCTVTAVAGTVTATTVAGQAVDVASGLIVVPPGRD